MVTSITSKILDIWAQCKQGFSISTSLSFLGSAGTQIPREVKHVPGVTRFASRNPDGSCLILDIKDNKVGMKQLCVVSGFGKLGMLHLG